MPDHWVIAGLGNPGREYEKTRHNLGFWFLDDLARELSVSFSWEQKCHSWIAQGVLGDSQFFLLKPGTYMNESGTALQKFMNYRKLEDPKILVVVDDMALEKGKMRFRLKGSSGGHNGLKSIQNALRSSDYMRLKIGIGASPSWMDSADYVLGKVTQDEEVELLETVRRGVKILAGIGNRPLSEIVETINSNSKE